MSNTALIRTRDETDDQGRKPIVGIHYNPAKLTDEDRASGVEVPIDDARKPDLASNEKAKPWLTSDGNVEWDVTAEPDIDGAVDAMEDELGRGRVRQLYREYPDVVSALSRGRLMRAWEGLAEARDDGELTTSEWDQLVQIASDHHVPVPEQT